MSVKLKYISPELYVSDSIAVVGSSKVLLKNEWSKEIDKHDDVIRFNRAPTEGFEKFVGNKTTVRVANHHVFENVPIDGDCRFDKVKDLYPANFIKNQKNTKIVNMGGHNNQGWAQRDKSIHETSEAFLVNFSKINPKEGELMTVGFCLVKILVLSGVKPDLYGFGIPEGANSSHYWADRNQKSVCHNYNNERSILKKWEKEGKVKLFL